MREWVFFYVRRTATLPSCRVGVEDAETTQLEAAKLSECRCCSAMQGDQRRRMHIRGRDSE